jgi:glycosyltransferase involved in cell wall biosynthesis
MKIVHIEDFFHPDAGYQINILTKFMAEQGHDITIVTSKIDNVPRNLTHFFGMDNILQRDNDFYKNTGVKIIRLDVNFFFSNRAIFKKNIYNVVNQMSPDIIYVHGNDTFTGIRFVLNIKKFSAPLIMDSHMLEMASRNRFSKLFRWFYKKFITPIIIKRNIIVIRTQNDDYVIKHLGIPERLTPWISVGSDTKLFYEDRKVRSNFRQELGISLEDFVVLYTGKLDIYKGGLLLAEAFQEKFETNKKIILIIVGNIGSDNYGKLVKNTLEKSKNRIIIFPTQKYVDLPKFYNASDLSIFPKQCSLSFYDAQACKLPVLSEDNNINKDRLSYNNGMTFMRDNLVDFRKKIVEIADMDLDKQFKMKEAARDYVVTNYDYKEITKEYMKYIELSINSTL